MFNIPLHLLLVHFPIALAIAAAICDARGHWGKRPELHRLGSALSLWAAAGAALAMLTGLQLLGDRAHAARATFHAGMGLITGLTLIAVAMARYSAEAREADFKSSGPPSWLILELLAALAVAATAITGHRLVLGALGLL
jgi:uncharacterized membrane protein